jgi:eukaryotic-like serine/threonine-protein kinase
MSPEDRWRRVQDLCEAVEAYPPEEREPQLRRLEGDEPTREEVRRLLDALDAEERASGWGARPAQAVKEAEALLSVGPYEIEGLLGRGGMGTVYAAQLRRGGVVQQVAVKVLHSYMADAAMLERFEREHRLLATLDHPGIVRFLDAGLTSQKQPYLVMERVDGLPIDEYCDGKKLDIAGRVRLVMAACQAVQAAHRKLIVHLDLKPSNLLVKQDGQVKLLDFGTAKLLDPMGHLTTTRQLTPLYASPEQLRGEAVTTACDVYALGVILYELLSGAWPFGNKESLASVTSRAGGFAETRPMTQSITGESAKRLGMSLEQVRQALRGDLQVIVAKALRSEPGERYAGVGELADDLQRWLEERPVLARPQTLLYRASKYARRNRGALGLSAVLMLGLLGALGVAWWQQREKVIEGQRAQAATKFLLWMIESSNPMYGGKQNMTVLEMMERARGLMAGERLESAELRAALEAEFANYFQTAGKATESAALYAKSLETARSLGKPEYTVQPLVGLASLAVGQGNCPEGQRLMSEAEKQLPALEREKKISAWISLLVNRGEIRGACEGKAPLSLEEIATIQRLLLQLPERSLELSMPPKLFQALTMNSIGFSYQKLLRLPEARAAVEQGLDLARSVPQSQGVRIALLRTLAAIEYSDRDIGASARALGQAVEASEGFTSPFEYERLKVMWARRLAENGELEKAADLARSTIAAARKRAAEIGPMRWMILVDGAMALRLSGHCAEVPAVMAEADALTAGKMAPQWRGNRTSAEGLCLVEMGRRKEAQPLIREALQVLGPMFSPTSKLKKDLEAALLP